MKKLPLFSLGLLFLAFSCETEAIRKSEPSFVYNKNQQFVTTESFVIDFENFSTGDIVSEIVISDPFENAFVAGITTAFPNTNAAMVFDSANPTGNDFDLGTPNEQYGGPGIGDGGASNDTALNNVLILSEDLDSTDPDDIFEFGASFLFDFSANEAVTLNSFDILDIETSTNATVVNLFDVDLNLLLSKEIMPGGDNSKVTVDLENTADVAFMEIIMNNSGAIDNIALEMEIEEDCVECDSHIVSLSFRYNRNTSSSVRVETLDAEVLFDDILELNDEFTISGNAPDGTFTSDLIIFVDDQELTTLATDCSQVIGPNFLIVNLEVIAGETLSGGQLCPVQVAF